MGLVYRARDLNLDTDVVKAPRREMLEAPSSPAASPGEVRAPLNETQSSRSSSLHLCSEPSRLALGENVVNRGDGCVAHLCPLEADVL